ncbi:hypothetical protein DNHGIG_28260 [Collibacillus ludicampi]|uniref:Sporulation histidine kinase inhibitor Sda n=1 Tax=Collibacillus ludicampi TaxID=2771369 RepID=A0AAV4LIM4_9BACL|nr:hypothetical protein DNHGIG_28260 [Collibacillus ludicampi]
MDNLRKSALIRELLRYELMLKTIEQEMSLSNPVSDLNVF